MNRNKDFNILEFIDDKIRLSIGEYNKDKFYIFDTFSVNAKGYKDGEILDEEEFFNSLTTLMNNAMEKMQFTIENVLLVLPTLDLNINKTSLTLPVLGKNSLVCNEDINSSLKVASKVRHDRDKKIVDIVPVEFTLDEGQVLDFIPIGYKSSTLKVLFNIMTLPSVFIDSIMNSLKRARINVVDYFLDINCLYSACIIEEDLDISILNLNKNNSSIVVYRKGKILEAFNSRRGIEEIINKVTKSLDIERNKAENLVLREVSATSSLSSKRSVLRAHDRYYNEKEISILIEDSLKNLLNDLFTKASSYLNENNVDVVVAGKGSSIKNLASFITVNFNRESSIFASNILGLSDSNQAQTIGIIKINSKNNNQSSYKDIDKDIQENRSNDIIKGKDNKKNDDKSTSDIDDFIFSEKEIFE